MRQNFKELRRVLKTLNNLENELRDQFDINLDEGNVLCLLSEKPFKAMDIPYQLGIAISVISRKLGPLEDKILIERETGKRDAREVYFKITNKGKALLEAIQASKINLPVISIEDDD